MKKKYIYINIHYIYERVDEETSLLLFVFFLIYCLPVYSAPVNKKNRREVDIFLFFYKIKEERVEINVIKSHDL